jgi:hypothetical protein
VLRPTPPAITIAKGGQKSPPDKSSRGKKPPMVVRLAETMWRVEPSVSPTIA